MKISANSLRVGNVIVHENSLWTVAKQPTHVKPGKGPAYVQAELKNLKIGTKLNIRFNSDDYLEKAQLEQKEYQYLYPEEDKIIFMDLETFEQIYLPNDILDERVAFLQDNMKVMIEFFDGEALSVQLPNNVTLTVEDTQPVIKGATATSSYKPAVTNVGITVMVPSYITSGEKIVVKTEDSSFVERAK